MAASKDLKYYLKELNRAGFKCVLNDGHTKVIAPDGQLFTCSGSPGCLNAHKQLHRDIRKYRRNQSYFLPSP